MEQTFKNHLDRKQYENSAELVSYASGDGSISFVFQDSRHNATGLKVTYRDVDVYTKENPNFQGWRLLRFGPGLIKAYQPVTRVSNDEVMFNGKTFFYTKDGFHRYQILTEDHNGHTVEVKNENIKAAITFWLEHDEGYAHERSANQASND